MRFDHLLPEAIFQTVALQGFRPTGLLFPLNSYENRVYEVGVETEETPGAVIAKYYRPGRWSAEAIAEEHRFVKTLAEAEIPVVGPLPLKKQFPAITTLAQTDTDSGKIFYTLFPKFRGREHAEITNDDRRWLGRTLARMHNVAEHFVSNHRLHLTPQTYGHDSLSFILTQTFLPTDLKELIEQHLLQALELVAPHFGKNLKTIPLHGDCHPGNILWSQGTSLMEGPYLLDFDDMVVAPPVQDIWMLFNGSDAEKQEQQEAFFEGYEIFREFDRATLTLAEPLRTLRMIRHAAWIGQRYEEPTFQRAFPYYTERRYWEVFLQSIKEQISLLQELAWG